MSKFKNFFKSKLSDLYCKLPVFKKPDKALNFDGGDMYIEIPDDSDCYMFGGELNDVIIIPINIFGKEYDSKRLFDLSGKHEWIIRPKDGNLEIIKDGIILSDEEFDVTRKPGKDGWEKIQLTIPKTNKV